MKKTILVIVFILLAIWILGMLTDYILATQNKKPIFAIPIEHYKDGGTVVYYGLFYKVIKYNELDLTDEEGTLIYEGREDSKFYFWGASIDD